MKKVSLALLLILCPMLSMAQKIYAEQDSKTKLYGIKKNGRWLVNPIYSYAIWDEFNNAGGVNLKHGGKYAVVNDDGKIITDFEYDGVGDPNFSETPNLIGVQKQTKDDKWLYGVIDRKGNVLLPCVYRFVFSEKGSELSMGGIGVITPENKCGMMGLDGKVIIEPKYSNYIAPGYFHNDIKYIPVNLGGEYLGNSVPVPTGGKWGIVNRKGEEVIQCIYDAVELSYIWDYYFIVNEGGDNKGKNRISGGKWGLVDDKNNILVPCIYDNIKIIDKGLFAVNKGGVRDSEGYTAGGKWGLYANGKEVVACQFDNVPEFNNDVATVKINGQVKLLKNPLKDGTQIQIASGDKSSDKKGKGPVVSRYPAPDSDVDKNIPTAKVSADNTFAFIIANENYADAPVPYSLNDGRMFKEYCQKTLGVPEKNINLYEDATYGNIITAVEKVKQIADAYEGEASVIFYYAGHGFPDEKQATAYLLPIDGNASDITTTGYSLAKFYQEISKLKLKSSVVFLDACFSGSKREDQMLSESRGVAIKVKEEAPQGNMLVFSAAQGDETAHQMEEKHHGLFTYYLLKELQSTGGDVDMGTLTEYVTKQVKRQSVVINNKKQTPTVIPSQFLTNSWQSMKLK